MSILATAFAALTLCIVLPIVTAAQESKPKIIKTGIINGRATRLPTPVYPPDAKAEGIEGTVYVDVIVDPTGDVISAVAATEPRTIKRPGDDKEIVVPVADERLRRAAEEAALAAKFSPATHTGPPVQVAGTLVYRFVARTPRNINGGVLNGKAKRLPRPDYPPAARAVRAEGLVTVQILIDEGGNVISAEAVSGHPLLRSAAVEAARNATFAPTRLQGTPVTVSGVLTYNFVL